MLSNLHTHTTFCDGKNTPEEIVLSAVDKGFSSIGFSGHGYALYSTYGMKNTEEYIKEILRLRERYRDKIQVYLGIEEDSYAPVDRSKFDYIIGSSHYFFVGDKYYPIDSSNYLFKKCLELFDYNVSNLAKAYYTTFIDYIMQRKPDIIGHFDLITKFDELGESLFLNNGEYNKFGVDFAVGAASSGCIFEVNTGAISRGYRTSPYPSESILYALKKEGARITVSSDSHQIDTLDFAFDETRRYLYDIGFRHAYVLYDGEFIKDELI